MSSRWMRVTRDPKSAMPLMPVQAMSIAGLLCVGETICAPIYVSLSSGTLALVPWAMVACLVAVVFTYTVGFALLWCAEAFSRRIRAAFVPLIYAAVGLVGFGAWGYFVISAVMNSILEPLGHAALSSGQLAVVALNCAVLGLASFTAGYVMPFKLAAHRSAVVALGVLTALAGLVGAFFMIQMYAVLY